LALDTAAWLLPVLPGLVFCSVSASDERTGFPEQCLDGDRRAEHVAGEALVETFVPGRRTVDVD